MKKQFQKAALAAAIGLGVSTAAQAQINNDDLVLGFTSTSATTDYIINLGQLLGTGAHQITLSGSQYSDSAFTAALGTAVTGGTASAGIFGGNNAPSGDVIISAASTPTQGTYTDEHSGSAYPASVSLGAVPQTGQSVHNNISTAPGATGANPTSMGLYVPSPLEAISSAQGTGGSVLDLSVFRSTFTAGFPSSTTQPYANAGFVSILFSANGGISGVAWDEAATAAAVPEPGTYGLFAGAGLLVLALRRQLTGKTA